jgi:VCBS repeat-containing protein
MKKILFLLLLSPIISFSQKKPLDHTVYDSWQRIDEKLISANGKFVAYTIAVQEGDANLVIQRTNGDKLIEVARGYNITITDDDKFVVFKIKPTYKQTRDAKIAKKKPDEMPKDSLGIYDVDNNKLEKIARVKSYKTPEKAGGWLAYLMEKPLLETKDKKELDSIGKINELSNKAAAMQKQIDSLNNLIAKAQEQGIHILTPKKDSTSKPKKEEDIEEGTELVLRNLSDGKEQKIKLVQEYYFDKKAYLFLIETTKKNNTKVKSTIIINDLSFNKFTDTLLLNFIDAKQFTISEDGHKISFVATFDTTKSEQKKYFLYAIVSDKIISHKNGGSNGGDLWETSTIENSDKGIPTNFRINENASIYFSKSGQNLFFGTSPSLPIKDTTLPEFERVNVDLWNYKDDDLMTAQLKNVDAETKKSYLAVCNFNDNKITQLGSPQFEPIRITQEGDGKYFYALSDSGKRVEQQWQGFTKKDLFVINSNDGSNKQIMSNVRANIYPSYTGKYLLVYDEDKKQYSCYDADSNKTKPVAKDIPYPLYDEENDVPDAPNAYGIVKWMENDKYVLIYDRYDLWKVDPTGKEKSICITNGRKAKIQYRYVTVDNDEKFIKEGQEMICSAFYETTKVKWLQRFNVTSKRNRSQMVFYGFENVANILKSKQANVLLFTDENFNNSQNLFTSFKADTAMHGDYDGDFYGYDIGFRNNNPLSNLNPQQSNYLWGSAELFKWKAYTGKLTEGILYKPDNFDSTKKYPMIVYFYERLSNTLHNYIPPAPTASRLNISYFVSNGYVVFVPDIWYTTGKPGKSAYDCIVSGTRALIKKGFIDSTKIGLQGQSWGGYQTAYLITQTNLYKAAWAGAPVGNMFSAYGGIRWESGLNRQFQYEHQQSRIGASIWEKPNLYIENSPLFHLPKVKTPLVIMHNDADGAVPWYQGIELFTAMRRLNKPVWMLNYNGEAHNLVERKNRKDIQVKEQQYFDWLLKDAPAPKWITDGVPAVMKGRVGFGTGN